MLAQVQLRAGDAATALSTLQALLDQGNEAEALALAAEIHLQQGDAVQAEALLRKSAEQGAGSARGRLALALLHLSKGKFDQGVAELRAMAAEESRPHADLALVNAFVQRRDWAQALKAVDGLEAKQPGKPGAAMLRGRIQLLAQNKARARQQFEAALSQDALFYPAAAALASLDMEAGQPEAAAAHFNKILAAEPQHLQAQLGLIALREKAGASKDELANLTAKLVQRHPQEVAPRRLLVRLQLDRGQTQQALAAAQAAANALPDNAELLDLLARTQALGGDRQQALSSYKKLVMLQPSAPEPQLRLAELQAAQKDLAGARGSLKRALELRADYLPAQKAMFLLDLKAGQLNQARTIAKTVQRQRPAEPVGWALAADADAAQKNWNEAIANTRLALGKKALPELAVGLHRLLRQAGRDDEARRLEAEWLAGHPTDPAFRNYLGDLALDQKAYDRAQQQYQAVLKLRPDNAVVLNNMAWLLFKTGRPGALDHAERANKLAPNQPPFMDTLAEILAGGGKVEQALALQKRAVLLAPEWHQHRLRLAQYYLAAGQKDQARQELQRLVALGDKLPQQAEVAKLMAAL